MTLTRWSTRLWVLITQRWCPAMAVLRANCSLSLSLSLNWASPNNLVISLGGQLAITSSCFGAYWRVGKKTKKKRKLTAISMCFLFTVWRPWGPGMAFQLRGGLFFNGRHSAALPMRRNMFRSNSSRNNNNNLLHHRHGQLDDQSLWRRQGRQRRRRGGGWLIPQVQPRVCPGE